MVGYRDRVRARRRRPHRAGALILATAVLTASLLVVQVDHASPAHAAVDQQAILRVGQSLAGVQGGSQFELDPAKSDLLQIGYLRPIYDTLVHQAPDGSLGPGLATAFKVVDSSTVDLTLRKGVKFQDGEPFTADAVKLAYERKLANPLANDPPLWKAFASAEVTGDLAVRLHLSQPVGGAFLNTLATSVQAMVPSPKAVAAGTLSEHPVGAGPFGYSDYKPEQILSLRKYKGYWDAKAYKLAGVDFVQVTATDPNAALSSLFAGAIDLQTIQQSSVDAVKGRSGFAVTTQPSQDSYYFLAVCQTTPPFDKPKFRQALQYAVNRDELNQIATNGTGVPAYMGWPKGSQYYVPEIAKRFSYNPTKAKQLLKEAGVAPGTSFNFISPVGGDLDRLAVVIKDELQKVGLDASIQLSQNIPVDLYENNKAPLTISLNVFPGVERLTRRFSPDERGELVPLQRSQDQRPARPDRLGRGRSREDEGALDRGAGPRGRLRRTGVPVLQLAVGGPHRQGHGAHPHLSVGSGCRPGRCVHQEVDVGGPQVTPATEPIISADDHMDLGVLPPALWVDGLPASLRERAPSVVETPHGRMWKAGDRFLGRSGQRSAGLLATEDPGFRPGVPTDRLADMDRDGVAATVIYGPFLSLMLSDPELASACERVYNEWALEFSAHDPTRLLALPFVPAHDPALAAEELVRIADAGHRGVLMYPWTDGDQPFEPSWEPFWAAADEIGFPVHFHIGGGLRTLQLRPGTWSMPAASAVVPMHIDELLVGLVFSGTLSRHPSVQVVLGEAGLGWIPYVLERMEHEYREIPRHRRRRARRHPPRDLRSAGARHIRRGTPGCRAAVAYRGRQRDVGVRLPAR